ncbi:MAG: caspase family protein [Nitrospirae bacterium]|nr:caspase family protein [Nitrospirota bacterium]MBF0616583.1 caspase family protein [Nitrospirota bacterium]
MKSLLYNFKYGNHIRVVYIFYLLTTLFLLIVINGADCGIVVKKTTYALFIGIDNYRSIQKLFGAVHDATEMSKILSNKSNGLVEPDNYVILKDDNATYNNIKKVLTDFKSKMSDNDDLIIYWSGHALYDEKEPELFLITYDTYISNDNKTGYNTHNSITLMDMVELSINKDGHLMFIGDGCNIGDSLISKLMLKYPNVSVLSASKQDEATPDDPKDSFTHYLIQALQLPENDLDGDGFISMEEAHNYVYRKILKDTKFKQHPTVAGKNIHRAHLIKAPQDIFTIDIDFGENFQEISSLGGYDEINVNGNTLKKKSIDNATISYSVNSEKQTPKETIFKNGLNQIPGYAMSLWYKGKNKKLEIFENPYKNSYALIIAVDDYERRNDTLKRKGTGFKQLGFMVSNGKKLKNTLKELGFPDGNIITLFEDNATVANIENILKKFYVGGVYEKTDRLFIYFGGHGIDLGKIGTAKEKSGYLVTYDYDKSKPALTSLRMKDLTDKHFESIKAKHVLLTIDSCMAGLALPNRLEGNKSEEEVQEFKKFKELAIIRNDTISPSRNVLVAGTKDQLALELSGGVFTKALISGLEGKADLNEDGIIQFDELSIYVRNEVAGEAAKHNINQQVNYATLDDYGGGKVLFLRGSRK